MCGQRECTLYEQFLVSSPSLCSGHYADVCTSEEDDSHSDEETGVMLSDNEDISDHAARPTLVLSGGGFQWKVDPVAWSTPNDKGQACSESSSVEEEEMETVEVREVVRLIN